MSGSSVAALIVSHLRAAGVRTLCGVPGGGGNLDLIDAARRGDLPFVLTQTETAGALMACAQAELTGRPAACLSTLGPGAASIVNGVAHAWLDRVPLLVFTDRQPVDPDVYLHQRLDQAALFAPITKGRVRLRAETAAADLPRAIQCALAAPAGPVHIDCAPDAFAASGDVGHRTSDIGQQEWTPDAGHGTSDEGGLTAVPAAVARLVAGAERPLVIAGLGAAGAEAARAVREFCEVHAIPALVTYKAKGVIADDSPLFAGVFTNGAIERPIMDRADLLIGVGLDPVELLPRPWSFAPPIVACGALPAGQRHIPFAGVVAGAVPEALRQFARLRRGMAHWDLDDIRRAASHQRDAVRIDAPGLTPARAIAIAADLAGADARVTIDAGAHMLPAVALWPVAEPRRLLISNGLSTMGFALPAAIGASLVDPDRPTIAVTGDGGLLMCPGELKTAVREQAPVLTLVLNDAALSLIKIKQDRRGLGSAGVALGEIDWCAMATGMGMPAWRADDEGALEAALSQALRRRGPALVDARVNPAVYPATMTALRG